jgi:hypothetical protein
MTRKLSAPQGPATRDKPGFRRRKVPPSLDDLLAPQHGKRGRVRDSRSRQRTPLEQACLERLGDRLRRVQAENPVVARKVQIAVRRGAAVCRHNTCSILACDAWRGISGVMVDNQDFGAGKKSFQGPPQAQGVIRGVQHRSDWRHGAITVPPECTTARIRTASGGDCKNEEDAHFTHKILFESFMDYCAARSCPGAGLIYGVRPNIIPVSTSTGCPSRRYRLNFHCCKASVIAFA